MIYFATDTRNPTPYGGVIPGMRDEQQRVILEALETVRYVVMSDIDQQVYTYYQDELPAVQRHLERHFRVPSDFFKKGVLRGGWFWLAVLEPGPDRGETAADFIDMRSEARPWIRHSGGGRSPTEVHDEKMAVRLNRRYLAFALGVKGGGIDFELDIPAGSVFQGDVGYAIATGVDEVYKHPRNARLSVAVGRGGSDGEFEELAAVEVLKSETSGTAGRRSRSTSTAMPVSASSFASSCTATSRWSCAASAGGAVRGSRFDPGQTERLASGAERSCAVVRVAVAMSGRARSGAASQACRRGGAERCAERQKPRSRQRGNDARRKRRGVGPEIDVAFGVPVGGEVDIAVAIDVDWSQSSAHADVVGYDVFSPAESVAGQIFVDDDVAVRIVPAGIGSHLARDQVDIAVPVEIAAPEILGPVEAGRDDVLGEALCQRVRRSLGPDDAAVR